MPGISQTLRKQMVSFIHEVRTLDLKKLPSVSETIDWARVLVLLRADFVTRWSRTPERPP